MITIFDGFDLFKIIPETEFEKTFLEHQRGMAELRYGDMPALEAKFVKDDLSDNCKEKTVVYVTYHPSKNAGS